jgi:putative hydrolase of the HAD superfamily
VTRAVVFDLWETLAAWPRDDPAHAELVGSVGMTLPEWAAADQRDRRWTGSFRAYLDWLGVDGDLAARAVEERTEMTRRSLVPIDGAVRLLDELRARGLRLGLISNCSSEVADVWDESPFAGKFDVVVLSASEGVCKPAAGIYRLALGRLGVEAGEAVFVGDGDSGELPGAEAVGMRAVQLGDRDGWHGERIATLAELRGLLEPAE